MVTSPSHTQRRTRGIPHTIKTFQAARPLRFPARGRAAASYHLHRRPSGFQLRTLQSGREGIPCGYACSLTGVLDAEPFLILLFFFFLHSKRSNKKSVACSKFSLSFNRGLLFLSLFRRLSLVSRCRVPPADLHQS